MENETTKTEISADVGGQNERLVMFLWRVVRWLLPRLAVIFAIVFGVSWGGMFHTPWDWFRGITSWAVIWAAINYYKWHTNKYET